MPIARWKAFFIAALMFFTAAVSGPGGANAGDTLSIGLIAPMAGEFYRDGVYASDAARFAVGQVNAAGGLEIDGRRYRVELATRDSRNMPAVARKTAEELVNKVGISALIGPIYSGNAQAASEVCEKAGVPMVLPFATLDDLTAGKQFVFRVPYTNSFQGKALARFVVEDLHMKTVAVIYARDEEYGIHLAQVFGDEIAALGGKVVASEKFSLDDRDFRPQMKRIAASDAEALFMPVPSQTAMIQIRQARAAGFKGVLLGSDSWDGTEVRRVKEANGAYFCDHWAADMPQPQSKAFAEAYQKDRRHMPVELEALTYDAAGLIFRAAQTAGSTQPKKIATALRDMPPYPGVTGTMDYTTSGDPDTYMIISRIKNGKVEFADLVEP